MRKAIYLIGIVTLSMMFSCDETKDFLNGLNEAPQINFFSNPQAPVLSDSIKLSLKNSQEFYRIQLKVTDKNENIREVRYNQLEGSGRLFQGGIEIIDNNIEIESDSVLLTFDYFPSRQGLHQLGLTATDNFEKSSSVTLQIIGFDNLKPIARAKASVLGKRDRYEYVIDASESFDRDQRYGGKLVEYEFTHQGKISYVLAENDKKLTIIFPEIGIYPVSVRVRDNDDTWSDQVRLEVDVR